VIDEEAVADLGAGVDFDEGEPARDLGEKAGEEAEVELPEPVIDAVKPERVQAGIAKQDLEVRARGGIALEDGADVVANGLEEGKQVGVRLWASGSGLQVTARSGPKLAPKDGASLGQHRLHQTATACISCASLRRFSNNTLLK